MTERGSRSGVQERRPRAALSGQAPVTQGVHAGKHALQAPTLDPARDRAAAEAAAASCARETTPHCRSATAMPNCRESAPGGGCGSTRFPHAGHRAGGPVTALHASVTPQRRAAKKARSRSPASSASSPPATSGRWLRRGSASTSSTLPAAPAFGSAVAVHHAGHAGQHDRARAHRAGLERHVEHGVEQPPAPELLRRPRAARASRRGRSGPRAARARSGRRPAPRPRARSPRRSARRRARARARPRAAPAA